MLPLYESLVVENDTQKAVLTYYTAHCAFSPPDQHNIAPGLTLIYIGHTLLFPSRGENVEGTKGSIPRIAFLSTLFQPTRLTITKSHVY
jgi:hypothetical protein